MENRKVAIELFNNNLKLVNYVINKKFQGHKTNIPGYEYEDIVQVGNIALWKACLSYNSNIGIKFSTYAIPIITNEILIIIRTSKNFKHKSFNESVSLNSSVIEDEDGNKLDYKSTLISNDVGYDDIHIILEYLNKYECSKRNLDIIKSYIFENINQSDISKKYNCSQAQISRIVGKFKKSFKQYVENEII